MQQYQPTELHKEQSGFLTIRRYDTSFFELSSGETFTQGLALYKDQFYTDILPSFFSGMNDHYIQKWLMLAPSLIIVGTGSYHEFLPAVWQTQFYQQRIGIETMTTESACRTFSVLAVEERNALGIFFPIT